MTDTPQYLHPLHSVDSVVAHLMSSGTYLGARRTGRSTAIALALLASCIKEPQKYFIIKDHHGSNLADQHLKRTIQNIIDALGLHGFVFRDLYISLGTPKSRLNLYSEL